MHRHAAGQLGDRLIADKAGLGNDDLVPGLDHRADDQVDGLTAADRDKDIFLFIVQVKAAAKVAADLIAQLLQAGVGCVLGAAQLKAADACIADAPRRFQSPAHQRPERCSAAFQPPDQRTCGCRTGASPWRQGQAVHRSSSQDGTLSFIGFFGQIQPAAALVGAQHKAGGRWRAHRQRGEAAWPRRLRFPESCGP